MGFEDAFADEGAKTTDPNSLDRPLAAMYRKGFGKGKGKKGKGKGGGQASATNPKNGGGKGGGGKTGKGKGDKQKNICGYCHRRGHDESDGCWSKERGEPRATGPKPTIASVEGDWSAFEAEEDSTTTGMLRDAGTLDRYIGSVDRSEMPSLGIEDHRNSDEDDSESPGLVVEEPFEIGRELIDDYENSEYDEHDIMEPTIDMLSLREFEFRR